MHLNLTITIGTSVLALHDEGGVLGPEETLQLATAFLQATSAGDQATIDQLTHSLAQNTDGLREDVTTHQRKD